MTAILPCTPLALVKTMEYLGVYNSLLPYGQRAYGRVITVVNRCVSVSMPQWTECENANRLS